MEHSDFLGLAGSACLLVAPIKDQWLRYKNTENAKRASEAPPGVGRLRLLVSDSYQKKRHSYSGYDTAFMIAGAALLGLSYIVQP